MAHGIGRYWIRLYNHDIKNDEYCVIFERVRNYYYEPMSDCYEPSWEWENEYAVIVLKWRKDKWGHLVADHISESAEFRGLSKNEANYFWWNLKNRKISFAEIKAREKAIEAEKIRKWAEERKAG